MTCRQFLPFALAVALVVGSGPRPGCGWQDDPAGKPLEDQASPSRVLADPFDFSEVPPLPEVDPPTAEQVDESLRRGVEFLLKTQNRDGSWGSHVTARDFEVFAPVPGAHLAFRAATTGLAVSALCECDNGDPRIAEALDRAGAWLVANVHRVKRADSIAIYNVWSHAYTIRALLRLRARPGMPPEVISELDGLVRSQLDFLDRYESVDGGWGYYDFEWGARKPTSSSISFVNATVLIAFYEARHAGFRLNEKTLERALAATRRQQRPDFAYLYGEYLKSRPMMEINFPGGSLARSQSCNLALRLWGQEAITDNVLKTWLIRLYVRNGWLDRGRKLPIPHESWMYVSGYFYYYGHYYAGQVIEVLPADERAPYQDMLARLMIDRQQPDGAWWDYPLYSYHKQYGTAYALMALVRCKR